MRNSGSFTLYCNNIVIKSGIKKRNQLIIKLITFFKSEPGGTRIPNLLIRSQMLYPIKLQVPFLLCRKYKNIFIFRNIN
jgi:hypothetical protein